MLYQIFMPDVKFYDFKKPDRNLVSLGRAIKKARSLLNLASEI